MPDPNPSSVPAMSGEGEDIVARLRTSIANPRSKTRSLMAGEEWFNCDIRQDVLEEAASEIERLRGLVGEARKAMARFNLSPADFTKKTRGLTVHCLIYGADELGDFPISAFRGIADLHAKLKDQEHPQDDMSLIGSGGVR